MDRPAKAVEHHQAIASSWFPKTRWVRLAAPRYGVNLVTSDIMSSYPMSAHHPREENRDATADALFT